MSNWKPGERLDYRVLGASSYFYLLMYTAVQHDFHIKWWLCRLIVTQQVPLVEQELLALPEHLSSPPGFSGVHVAKFLVFCVLFCRSLFFLCPFFLCHCSLCVLCFSASQSEYPFGIFKLFLSLPTTHLKVKQNLAFSVFLDLFVDNWYTYMYLASLPSDITN